MVSPANPIGLHGQHLQLRLAADAARASLAQLQIEYDGLIRRMADTAESMRMLQNVVDAWERLNPERDPLAQQLVRIDQELRDVESGTSAPRYSGMPAWPKSAQARAAVAGNMAVGAVAAAARMPLTGAAPLAGMPRPAREPSHDPWPARGEITERVHRVLMTGASLSPTEAHAALDARYRGAYSINAVSLAMRHGAESGHYQYNGKTGQYRIASG